MTQLVSRLMEHGCEVSVPCGLATASAAWIQYLGDGVLPLAIASTIGLELDVQIDHGQTIEQVQPNLVRVQGHLILDDVPMRAIVELDLETLRGFARLHAGTMGERRAGKQDSINDSAFLQTQTR